MPMNSIIPFLMLKFSNNTTLTTFNCSKMLQRADESIIKNIYINGTPEFTETLENNFRSSLNNGVKIYYLSNLRLKMFIDSRKNSILTRCKCLFVHVYEIDKQVVYCCSFQKVLRISEVDLIYSKIVFTSKIENSVELTIKACPDALIHFSKLAFKGTLCHIGLFESITPTIFFISQESDVFYGSLLQISYNSKYYPYFLNTKSKYLVFNNLCLLKSAHTEIVFVAEDSNIYNVAQASVDVLIDLYFSKKVNE